MEQKDLCYNCFREKPEGPCPYCGFDLAENERKFPVALRAGMVLNGRYIVGRVLGQGGFGITYLAWDTKLEARVAVKEFMPNEIATRVGTTVSVAVESRTEDFTYGAERFQEEARTLAKFMGQPNIAGVTDYFDENDTSYFVMDYIEGISFKTYIEGRGGKVSVEEALNVMIPVLRALTAVHAEGFIHRDVTPDNIYITKDGQVKLLDFGSARYSIGDKSKSLDVILKVGYAPKEQYIRRSRQGPYTDVYSCAACFYAAITGFLPPESLERLDSDTLVPISQTGIEIPEYLDKAILKGLAVQPEDRFQSAAEFLEAIERQQVVEVPAPGGAATPAPTPEKKKVKPALIAGIAAAIVVAVGVGIAIGGGGGETAVDADGEKIQLVEAEVPSITIQGTEYSTDLTELTLTDVVLTDTDLEQIGNMVNLRKLTLENQTEITSLAPLSNLTNLTSLNLHMTPGITDISPLTGLTKLEGLSLTSCINNAPLAISDLSPLSNLTQLEELYCTTNGICEFSWVKPLTNLRTLHLGGAEANYDNVDDLSGLTKLESLYLPMHTFGEDAMVYNIQGLSGMTAMRDLNIPGGVDDLTPLRNMCQLRSLYVSGGGNSDAQLDGLFTSLEPLRNLSELTELRLDLRDRPEPVDLEPLSGLTKLQGLYLDAMTSTGYGGHSTLANLSALANLKELRQLTLDAEGIEDISPLKELTNLQNVRIRGLSPNADASPLDHVPNAEIQRY